MAVERSSMATVRQRYLRNEMSPLETLRAALARANSNASRNVYLSQDVEWSEREARGLRREDIEQEPLWGIPVSLKDCFDLEGFPTSCGSRFYMGHHGIAGRDSSVAARLRGAGAILTGKTHLHQLAYGITGENRDFGDCVQPMNSSCLTGGSSSGAAASVQEGSAMAAIGTDTGGSIRAPAALCGVAGYRSSISLNQGGIWEGGYHLAATFDTVGWLYGDLVDGPLLGHALLDLQMASAPSIAGLRIGIPDASFTRDCDEDVSLTLDLWRSRLERQSARVEFFDAARWEEALAIYAPLQASEAAAIHRGYYEHFEPVIAERLTWGASLPAAELGRLRERLIEFRELTDALFDCFDYLLLPCAPVAAIGAGVDHMKTRARILRYTTPASVAGLPVVTLPEIRSGRPAGGLQLVGRMGSDAELLALSAAFS